MDAERRVSIDSRSDAGFRAVGASGLVVNYKRLMSDSTSRMRVAIMPGAGLLNFASHAHFEATLIMSAYEPAPGSDRGEHRTQVVPYGGLRVMQVAPLSSSAVHDTPTAGGFLGVKFGSSQLGVSPEIGVFYDESALDVRKGRMVVVPSINVHGDDVIHFLLQALPLLRAVR